MRLGVGTGGVSTSERTRSQMTDATQRLSAGSREVDSPRRRWSEAQKRRIVAESYRSGDSVSVVAHRHGVHASVLFRGGVGIAGQRTRAQRLSRWFQRGAAPLPARGDRVAQSGAYLPSVAGGLSLG